MKKLGTELARRLAVLAVVGGTALGAVPVATASTAPTAPAETAVAAAAAPANACRLQKTKVINLADGAGQYNFIFDVCVASDGKSKRNAFVRNIWWEGFIPPGHLFHRFLFVIRLERNGKEVKKRRCDFTKHVNSSSIPTDEMPGGCNLGPITTSARGGWTADGYLAYKRVGVESANGDDWARWQYVGTRAIN